MIIAFANLSPRSPWIFEYMAKEIATHISGAKETIKIKCFDEYQYHLTVVSRKAAILVTSESAD